jgi:prenyltransferase beta subunit
MKRFLLSVALLVCWVPFVSADPPRNIQETIGFLQKLQTKEGGFLFKHAKPSEKAGNPTLRFTSTGVRALKYFDGKVLDKEGAAKYVASCHHPKSGGFANLPGADPDVFTTAIGLMAVVELGLPVDKYAPGAVKYLGDNATSFEDIRIAVAGLEAIKAKTLKADAWLKQIANMQNADGTFGMGNAKARDTGGAVVAILRLGGEVKNKAAVVKALKDGQNLNGGWGKGLKPNDSDLESSYRIMRAFVMLKELPDDVEGIRTYVEKCRNNDGGYSVAPAEESNVSGCYYAAIIHHWLKDKK